MEQFNHQCYYSTLQNRFQQESKEYLEKLGQLNIIAIGKNGVGKSTILNSVFQKNLAEGGFDRPITKDINSFSLPHHPITIYDAPGLELSFLQSRITKFKLNQLIRYKNISSNPKKHIHIIWYFLSATSTKLEKAEEKWINELEKKVRVIVVENKVSTQSHRELQEDSKKQLSSRISLDRLVKLPLNSMLLELPSSRQILKEQEMHSLVTITLKYLPEVARNAFIAAQMVNWNLKIRQARLWVITIASGELVIATGKPLPFADLPLMTALNMGMLVTLNSMFGVVVSEAIICKLVKEISGQEAINNMITAIPEIDKINNRGLDFLQTVAVGFAYIEAINLYYKVGINGDLSKLAKKAIEQAIAIFSIYNKMQQAPQFT